MRKGWYTKCQYEQFGFAVLSSRSGPRSACTQFMRLRPSPKRGCARVLQAFPIPFGKVLEPEEPAVPNSGCPQVNCNKKEYKLLESAEAGRMPVGRDVACSRSCRRNRRVAVNWDFPIAQRSHRAAKHHVSSLHTLAVWHDHGVSHPRHSGRVGCRVQQLLACGLARL